MKKIIVVMIWLLAIDSTFAQTYKTPLRLATPRISGPEVLAVQTRLIELGFSKVGSADGWFGPLTKEGVSSFQWFLGFNQTGEVDSRVWDTLFSGSMGQSDIDSAIREANTILGLSHTKKSHDIMERSTEGGMVDQYFSNGKIAIEDFWFFGELGKVEYKVIHLANGLVVLEKEYQYPEPFDLAHAEVTNSAFYFLGKTSVKAISGKLEKSETKDLSIYELIGKTGT